VSDEISDEATRDWSFQTLRKRPEALFAVIDTNGYRIPFPASLEIPEAQQIPCADERTTMLDLVVPADQLAVADTWFHAETHGVAMTSVHLRSTPDRLITLTYLDLRHSHGVWISALTEAEYDATDNRPAIDPALFVPRRPRTASMSKTWGAIITDIDDRTTRMLGWTPEQMIGLRTTEFLHPDDHPRALASWMEMLAKKESQRVRLRHRRSDGEWLWVELENVYHDAEANADVVVVCQLTDISDEMAAYEELDRREWLFRRLAESMPAGLLQLDANAEVVYTNARLGEIFGVSDDHLSTVVGNDRAALDTAIRLVLDSGEDQTLEVAVRVPGEAEDRHCFVNLVALVEPRDRRGGGGALACVTDVTDSARLRAELQIKATYDALTGCHNRASILAAIEHAIATDTRPPAVIFVDLDKFKPVNDSLGHAAGDELLVHMATGLTALLRHDDAIGRIGGDEFLLLCRNVENVAEAAAIAQRVRDTLHRPIELSAGDTVQIGASIGVAFAEPGDDADSLIAHADAAMYVAKRRGGDEAVSYARPRP
jgi:diguanylate cyclase (GGDEF)-like protein/PAS domain S-box-containing protein